MIYLASQISNGTFKLIHLMGAEFAIVTISGIIWTRILKKVIMSPFEISLIYPRRLVSIPLESLEEIELKQVYMNSGGSILEAAIEVVIATINEANQKGEIVITIKTDNTKVTFSIGTYGIKDILPLFDYFEGIAKTKPEVKKKKSFSELAMVWRWKNTNNQIQA